QDQQELAGARKARAVLAQHEIERFRAVGEGHDLVVHARAADVLLDEARVALVVLDHHDGDFLAQTVHACILLTTLLRSGGRRSTKVVPCPSSDLTTISPPRLRISERTWARPMPSPGLSCVPERRKSSKTRSWSSGAMPRPLSVKSMKKPARPALRAATEMRSGRSG